MPKVLPDPRKVDGMGRRGVDTESRFLNLTRTANTRQELMAEADRREWTENLAIIHLHMIYGFDTQTDAVRCIRRKPLLGARYIYLYD